MRHFGAAALSLEFEKKSLAKFGGGAPFPDRPGVLAFSTHFVAFPSIDRMRRNLLEPSGICEQIFCAL
ncbi:MAG: hypothetical protein WA231_09870 [Methylocella sp.]